MTDDAQFALFLTFALKHEGGFQAAYEDAGNWTGGRVGAGELKGTKFGISAASYPNLDIRNLTVAQAAEIYRAEYWDRYGFGRLNAPIGAKVCDLAINMGSRPEVKLLQQACCLLGRPTAVDGILGSVTVDTANAIDTTALLRALCAAAEDHYKAIVSTHPNDAIFLKGWLARADEIPQPQE